MQSAFTCDNYFQLLLAHGEVHYDDKKTIRSCSIARCQSCIDTQAAMRSSMCDSTLLLQFFCAFMWATIPVKYSLWYFLPLG